MRLALLTVLLPVLASALPNAMPEIPGISERDVAVGTPPIPSCLPKGGTLTLIFYNLALASTPGLYGFLYYQV